MAEALNLSVDRLADAHREWIEAALKRADQRRQAHWSESVAVGSQGFVERMSAQLGTRFGQRRIEDLGGLFVIREAEAAYVSKFGSEMRSKTEFEADISP